MRVIKNIIQQRQKKMGAIGRILDTNHHNRSNSRRIDVDSEDQELINRKKQMVNAVDRYGALASENKRRQPPKTKAGFKPPTSHLDIFEKRQQEHDFQTLQKNFLKYLKENGMHDESIESSEFVGYNKFDREIDPETAILKAKMYRPRDDMKKQGKPILGEEKVLRQLRRLKTGDERVTPVDDGENGHASDSADDLPQLEIDSLIESAFCSEENAAWE